MITHEKYTAIEWSLRRVSSAVALLATKEVREDLQSCEYILSVVRGYAKTFEDLPAEDRQDALEGLFCALYR